MEVKGFNIHPGSAKDKMKNASKIAMEFNAMLPAAECPEHTEGREGFYHLCGMQGDESGAVLQYILRDHDAAKLETKEAMMLAAEAYLNQKYGAGTVRVTLKDSYRNMREVIDRYPEVTQRALDAIRSAGDEPQIVAIRGGHRRRAAFLGGPALSQPAHRRLQRPRPDGVRLRARNGKMRQGAAASGHCPELKTIIANRPASPKRSRPVLTFSV